ncbi:alpha/beta fold hydrolase [Edwardsiella piscicida]|nr:alpha/beta fold hydrolase [Edwardsiella piscicida]
MRSTFRLLFLLLALISSALAQPLAPRHADWIARDFSFHDGARMDLTLHYRTLGEPGGMPVLLLHGTGGSGDSFITPEFADVMFGPGQPLDIQRYFIIMPDAIGHGRSSKPSDGLRARFPRYTYQDMVTAQFRLVTEGLGLPTCAWSWETPWAECTPGSGPNAIPTPWTRSFHWPPSRRRWPLATGYCAA